MNRLDPTCREMASSPIQVAGPLPGPALVGFLAGASMVRRSAFLQVGGFERRFFIGGEELLTLNLLSAGWEPSYADDVVVHHPSETSRDTARWRMMLTRNHLWIVWMRYPWPWAVRATARAVLAARWDRTMRAGLGAAFSGLPWALGRRNVAPTEVCRRLRQVADV